MEMKSVKNNYKCSNIKYLTRLKMSKAIENIVPRNNINGFHIKIHEFQIEEIKVKVTSINEVESV